MGKITSKIKQRKASILLVFLLLVIPCALFFGFKYWESSKIVDLEKVENAAVSLNGDALNENSVATVHVNFDRFYNYDGYMVDCSPDSKVAKIELYQKFSFVNPAKELFVDIPLAGLSDYEKIFEVQLVNLLRKQTKTIYLRGGPS